MGLLGIIFSEHPPEGFAVPGTTVALLENGRLLHCPLCDSHLGDMPAWPWSEVTFLHILHAVQPSSWGCSDVKCALYLLMAIPALWEKSLAACLLQVNRPIFFLYPFTNKLRVKGFLSGDYFPVYP